MRNVIDYNDLSITNELFTNIIERNNKSDYLNRSDIESIIELNNIKCKDDEFEELLEFAEFDENGNLDFEGI